MSRFRLYGNSGFLGKPLPPLGDGSSALPQLSKPNGRVTFNQPQGKSVIIEAQKMGREIGVQIAAVKSQQDQQINQLFSQCRVCENDFKPKLGRITHNTDSDRQQLDAVIAKVAELQANSVPLLQKKHDELKVKLEQDMEKRTKEKIRPVSEEILFEQERVSKLSDDIQEKLSKVSADFLELEQTHVEKAQELSDGRAAMRAKIDQLKPRLSELEAQKKTLETATQKLLAYTKDADAMAEKARTLYQEVEDFATDGIDQMFAKVTSEVVASISESSNQLEQGFSGANNAMNAISNDIDEMTVLQQRLQKQVSDLCTTLYNMRENIDAKTTEISEGVAEINSTIEKLTQEVKEGLAALGKARDDKRKAITDWFNGQVQTLRETSKEYLKKRSDEWAAFNQANADANGMIVAAIGKAQEHINDGLLGWIRSVKERIKWCRGRVDVWNKEDELRAANHCSGEDARTRLKEFEDDVRAIERRIAVIEEREDDEEEFVEVEEDVPEVADRPGEEEDKPGGEEDEPDQLVQEIGNLVLTYDEGEQDDDFPAMENGPPVNEGRADKEEDGPEEDENN